MEKIKAFLPIALFGIGGFRAYFGIEHKISFLSGIGFIFVSIGLILLGWDSIIKRELVEHNEQGRLIASYSGISVVFIGIFWCVLGISVFLIGIFFLTGNQQNFIEWVKFHPTLPYFLTGSMLISYGFHEFIGAKQESASVLPFIGSLPKRIFNAVLILIGLAAYSLGLLNFLLPAQYEALITFISSQYQPFRCSLSPVLCEE